MSDDQKTLIHMINNFLEIDIDSMYQLIDKLCQQKNSQFEYDGSNICQLTGKKIGEKSTIKLVITPKQSIVVLKDKLKQLIQKHCLINGVFEKSYSKLKDINITDSQNDELISIEITDNILIEVFSKEEYQQIMKKADVTFFCPQMKKTYLKFQDGITLQGQLYSIEGAFQILQNNRNKFFSHQIEYLEKIQSAYSVQQFSSQIKNDPAKFTCPKTNKQYYNCFEGIKLQSQFYSIEGLLQIVNNPEESRNLDKYKEEEKSYIKLIEKVNNS